MKHYVSEDMFCQGIRESDWDYNLILHDCGPVLVM